MPEYALAADAPDAFATTLLLCLVDAYGTEALSWSPETIRMETSADWGARWPGSNFDRLMAGIHLVTSDSFYKSLPDFNEMCLVLSGAHFMPDQWAPATSDDCAWGITEALLIAPPDEDDEHPFTDEIRHYVGHVTADEGIITPPDILRIALRDEDTRSRVMAGLSDDAAMSEQVWAMEATKTDEINAIVKARLSRLVEQLTALRLRDGDTTDIARKMLANLNARPKGGSPLP